jgi:preprotein translocase subunit YajC
MVLHTFYGCLAMMGRRPEGTQPNQTGEFLKMIPMIVFFFLIMYFLMIRPQQKKAREHTQMVKTLKPGDRVLTSGGVLGVVVSVKERSVSIRSADTKLEIVKSAVTEIVERSGGEAKAS